MEESHVICYPYGYIRSQEPYGITIQNEGVDKDLSKHFGIQELPDDSEDCLGAYKDIFTLDIWLKPDKQRIQWEYKAMEVYYCNEAEHSTYALRDIFLDEPRNPLTWDLWCIVPKTFEAWTGCDTSSIYSGDCCIPEGVHQMVSIVNNIHYWGLAIHGRSCKAGITAKIQSDSDADMKDITLLED
ncbi:hypothetical protein GQ44DRAFT_776673 [Phaeosphaeriaceae sp. PMI808]|nr:hypothetical protein GQ44DRAFT_776673 [Phaeosphaeriaceae sp. PMI808]